MCDVPKPVKLKAKVTVVESGGVAYHFLRFPKAKVEHFAFKRNLRRVVCTLNGTERFHCVLFPRKGNYSIVLSKKLRDKLGISEGSAVDVYLERDDSKYGLPMPEEFAEVLKQDPEGRSLFEALTPGNQRIMLQLVGNNKDVDKRIIRSLAGVELLKQNGGKFDYHMQQNGMRMAVAKRFEVEFEP